MEGLRSCDGAARVHPWPDTVIARDVDDAFEVWRVHHGELDEPQYREQLDGPLADDYELSIIVDKDGEITDCGEPLKLPVTEWSPRVK